VGEWKLRRILEAVRRLNPHVLVVTGDIIDVQAHRLDGLSGLFRALDPPWGKYAVTGNHEFYAGIDSAEEFAEKAGLKLLRGETAAAGPFLTVTGIDDYVVQVYEPWRKNRWETELLRKAPAGAFRILLKHKPIVEQAALGIMELQLSGHTHKGQIFPFTLATRGAYKTYAGLYDLGKGSLLYVSRGTGTWGPPVRFLAPPEVTLVEIVGVQP
jgi:predicted MPP superfamily phosphohydrolase